MRPDIKLPSRKMVVTDILHNVWPGDHKWSCFFWSKRKVGKDLLKLHCNVHPLDSMSSYCTDMLQPFNDGIPSSSYGKDCRSANLIINISKLRYKTGVGDPNGFSLFLQKHDLNTNFFPRFAGNGFNILFHSAGLILLKKDLLITYLNNRCNCKTPLRTATLADLQNANIVTQLQELGMIKNNTCCLQELIFLNN